MVEEALPAEAARPWLSVITTTDPVAKQLPVLLEKLSVLASDQESLIEVVVVDDLKQWASDEFIEYPTFPGLQIHVLWYPEHRGHMKAVRAGQALASADLVATIDPDMHACTFEFPEMAALLNKGYQAVHGQRLSRSEAGPIRFRSVASDLTNRIVQAITGVRVPDICSPVTLMRREVITRLSVGRQGCSRLIIYSALGSSVATYPLRNESAPESPSQYSLVGLLKAFVLLFLDALHARSKMKN